MENPSEPNQISVQNACAPLRDSLQGLAALNQTLAILDYGNVLIRRDYKSLNEVKILSGGCPGLDLNYAGFVGKGLITAVVLGETHVPPNSRLILRTIRELHAGNNDGIIVINQANSEAFNFGLACERAMEECLRVKHLLVDDNRSYYKNSCGMVLISKIAGAMAEKQMTYDDIHKICKRQSEMMYSVSLHNYGGVDCTKKIKLDAGDLLEYQVEDILVEQNLSLRLEPNSNLVILLNVPSKLCQMEEFILMRRIIDRLQTLKIIVKRAYSGRFLLAPNEDVMLTVMKVQSQQLLQYLDAPCSATGWKELNQSILPSISILNDMTSRTRKIGKMEVEPKGPKLGDKFLGTLELSVQFACDALISCERQLNLIDSERSKGNIGSRIKRACEHFNKRLKAKKIPLNQPYSFLKTFGIIAEGGIGGTLGSIYGLAFEGAANLFGGINESEMVTPMMWLDALGTAVDVIERYHSLENEFNTMLFPLRVCNSITRRELHKGDPFVSSFGVGVYSAEQAAMNTRPKDARHPDPGAHAVGIWLRALCEGVKLKYGSQVESTTQGPS